VEEKLHFIPLPVADLCPAFETQKQAARKSVKLWSGAIKQAMMGLFRHRPPTTP
jgi:hypothetical protein